MYAKMGAGICSHFESCSSQDNVPDYVFIDVLRPDTHDLICYHPPTVTTLHYYNSHYTVNLRQRVEMVEGAFIHLGAGLYRHQQMSKMHAFI